MQKRPVSNVLLPFLFTIVACVPLQRNWVSTYFSPFPSILMGTSRIYKCVLDEKKITSSSLKDGTLTHQIRNNGFRKPLFLTHVPSSVLLTTLGSWRSQLSHFYLTSSQWLSSFLKKTTIRSFYSCFPGFLFYWNNSHLLTALVCKLNSSASGGCVRF